MKKTVLFICVHNSARSQIAEGLMNALHGDRFEAVSGGTMATRVHPGAIEAMAEIAWQVNRDTLNIGARRLYTIMEKVVEDLSFSASER